MTQTSKHTPGPWRIKHNGNVWTGVETLKFDDPEYGAADHSVGRERWSICTTNGNNATANARLIAAAPDLLAACEAVLGLIDNDPNGNRFGCSKTESIVRIAIAKARGEQEGK